MINAGRGAGKTRSGAEWVRDQVKRGLGRIALIAPTSADARDVMVEGESGLLSVCWEKDRLYSGDLIGRPIYEPSKRQVIWENGAIAKLYSAEEPDRLRGPQHDGGWCDEITSWTKMEGTWDMYQFGLRLGDRPQTIITTTPKPSKFLKKLMANKSTVITTGSTYENQENLAPTFLQTVKEQYEGTRLGRQELYAEILDDVVGALWQQDDIDKTRINVGEEPDLKRLVIACDPSGGGDDIGIVAAGTGVDDRYYVLEDKTCGGSPAQWGRAVVRLHDEFNADRVVYERNYGGDMAEAVITTAAEKMHRDGLRDSSHIKTVAVNATRGKVIRAEPIAALYEQGRVSHTGTFKKLEDELISFTADWNRKKDGSPNRLDALVWALTDLCGVKSKSRRFAVV